MNTDKDSKRPTKDTSFRRRATTKHQRGLEASRRRRSSLEIRIDCIPSHPSRDSNTEGDSECPTNHDLIFQYYPTGIWRSYRRGLEASQGRRSTLESAHPKGTGSVPATTIRTVAGSSPSNHVVAKFTPAQQRTHRRGLEASRRRLLALKPGLSGSRLIRVSTVTDGDSERPTDDDSRSNPIN